MTRVTVSVDVDDQALYDSIADQYECWILASDSGDRDPDVPGDVTITAWDGAGEGDVTITRTITLADVAKAWEAIFAAELWHCGNRVTIDDLTDGGDACTNDLVAQMALYGRIVYG